MLLCNYYCTWHKRGPKEGNFFNFSSNFNAVSCKMIIFMSYWWTVIFLYYFISKKEFKMEPNSEIFHICKAYLTFEIVKQQKCPKYNKSSILLCTTHYCVKQNTVSTLMPLICTCSIFPLSTCCSCIMLCYA